jgi:hypothetical protein
VHAVGVRTDPELAYHEGFAAHFQVMAIDDPDAAPATRALVTPAAAARAEQRLEAYARELNSLWAPATRLRMSFPMWFSGDEQALRYFAVKENRFAREAAISDRSIARRRWYDAYLIEQTLPGRPEGAPKKVERLLSTEGVVSALFVLWATDSSLQRHYREERFYERFGLALDQVQPEDNVYLKIFHAMYHEKPRDTRALIEGLQAHLPRRGIGARRARGNSPSRPAASGGAGDMAGEPQLHGRNVGFRSVSRLPRVHTFDLNAASMIDLVTVPGVNRRVADAIIRECALRRSRGFAAHRRN